MAQKRIKKYQGGGTKMPAGMGASGVPMRRKTPKEIEKEKKAAAKTAKKSAKKQQRAVKKGKVQISQPSHKRGGQVRKKR